MEDKEGVLITAGILAAVAIKGSKEELRRVGSFCRHIEELEDLIEKYFPEAEQFMKVWRLVELEVEKK